MDEVNFQPGWLRRDVARAAKRMDEWFGGTGMERLSDERLLRILEYGGITMHESREVVKELLELRAKLAAYKQLDAAQCAQLTSYRVEDRRDHAARATLDSEREANRLLTEENERLRAKLAAGSVMPETPSDDVLYASLHPEVGSMNITEATQATRKYWPVPHWEYEHKDSYFAAYEGYDQENVGKIYASYEEAQAACDRMNLRAVLEAIREPSEGMVTAAERACGLWEGFLAEEGWRAMIDAAIKEIEAHG